MRVLLLSEGLATNQTLTLRSLRSLLPLPKGEGLQDLLSKRALADLERIGGLRVGDIGETQSLAHRHRFLNSVC